MKSVNTNNIFIDTNVLVGAWTDKKNDKDCLQYLFSLNGKNLYVSSLSIAQLVSVFQKKKSNSEIIHIVNDIMHRFFVLSFTQDDIIMSLKEISTDIEDNIQYIISKKMRCYTFVTNNIKDYRAFGDINAINPSKVRLIPR